MELKGKLFQVLAAQTGSGKNGPWKKCDFVIEINDKFPRKVCFSAWNELADQVEKMKPSADIKVSFDVSSREYNGKWYNDLKAWKVAKADNADGPEPPDDFPAPPPSYEEPPF